MSMRRQVRTTISLPAESLSAAKRLARARNVNLSTVVGEALQKSLKEQQARKRAEQILESYRQAFAGFSEEEMFALDGIIMKETRKKSR